MAYVRICLRGQWQKEKYGYIEPSQLLISNVVNIEFEKVCLERYEQIILYFLNKIEADTTLEHDQQIMAKFEKSQK